MNGGTSVSNVNSQYVEFGRVRDEQDYVAFRDANPAT
jgi:hypothetical protein